MDRLTDTALDAVTNGSVTLSDVYTQQARDLEADSVVLITARLPREDLLTELAGRDGLRSLRGVGDCWSPSTIAATVWSGRRAAEEFDGTAPADDGVLFRREVAALAAPDDLAAPADPLVSAGAVTVPDAGKK